MKIQTILTKNAGKSIPVELLANIINRRPSAVGGVVQYEEGGKPALSVHRESGTPTMGQLNEFLKNAEPYRAMLYFGELGPKFAKEDVQPITIDDGDGKPFICLGIEGDFSDYAETAGGHTEEYNYATQILIPSLIDILNVTNGDWDDIEKRLNEDRFNKSNVLSHLKHRGSVTLFPLIGDPIWLGKNELGEGYDWGQTSNRHGYGDAKQEPEKAPEAKKGFSFSGFRKQEASPPASGNAATKGTDGPRSSVPEVRADGKNMPQPMKLPDWVHKNDDKRTWYQMVGGSIPEKGWKNGVPIIPVIPEDKMPKDLADLRQWEADQLKEKLRSGKAVQVASTEPIHQPVKTETAAGAPKTGADIKAARDEEAARQIIGAKDMEKILDFAAKHLDSSSNEMMSIEDIIALEAKIGDFTDQIGVKPEETLNWPMSGLFALAKLDHRAIVLYAMQMRKLWRNTLKLEDLVGKPKATTTETKIGNNGKKVESIATDHILAKEELKPAKKGGFSFKKVA